MSWGLRGGAEAIPRGRRKSTREGLGDLGRLSQTSCVRMERPGGVGEGQTGGPGAQAPEGGWEVRLPQGGVRGRQ